MPDTHRNYGIDLLRIVCMLMVPVLHIIGGVLPELYLLGTSYHLGWLLESAVFSAVNCYALISGFVGVGSKSHISRLMSLHLQAMFYSIPITLLAFIIRGRELGTSTLLGAVFPFAFDYYWYYGAYFCLFFFMPALNFLLERMSKRQATLTAGSIILVFSLLPTILQNDFPFTASGYSALWLGALYFLGGYIRKHGVLSNMSRWKLMAGFILLTVFNWAVKMGAEWVTLLVLGRSITSSYLLSYTSPTVLLSAALLLLFFSRLELKGKPLEFTRFFAPAAFGVYLLHDNPVVRGAVVLPLGAWIGGLPAWTLIPLVLLSAVGIWFLGSVTDLLRLALFRRLRVQRRCEKLECVLDGKLERWLEP